jgi:uncharacterized protein YkwD
MIFTKIQHFLFPTISNNRHPSLYRYEALALILLVASVCELGAVVSTSQIGKGIFAAVLPSTLVELTNTERANDNQKILILNDTLTRAAQAKAEDMASRHYFAHNSPDGREPWWWFQQAGYAYTYAGENLAIDFNDSTAVIDAWMNSPKHRENILKGQYTQIGIGIAQGDYDGHATTFVVQFFGTPAASPSVSTPILSTIATSAPSITPKKSVIASTKTVVRASTSTRPLSVPITSTRPIQVLPVETAAAPVTGQVLGAESTGVTGWAYDTFLSKIIASPIKFVNNVFYIMMGLLMLLLLIGLLPIHAQWLHRYAFANGMSAIAVLLFCIVINTTYSMSARVAGVAAYIAPIAFIR